VTVPFPQVSLELEEDVFVPQEADRPWVDYVHYSVLMSRTNKQALVSAANLDQASHRQVSGRHWFVDPRIGLENQIGPLAYKRNPWDRGHLTRRSAVTWGPSNYVAKRASNDSCSYANASLQHENFNQDEWRVPEEVVRHFSRDKNDRLCLFTGPLFSQTDRWYSQRSLGEHVRIPSGFWKMLVYIDARTNQLLSQAFLMFQDDQFLMDKRDRHQIDIGSYQVTTTELEMLTGLDFGQEIFDSNPLYFYSHEGENEGPEGFRTPFSTRPEDLEEGLVFSRADIAGNMLDRKREIQGKSLEELLANVWFS
jgi:endonuclease G